MHYQIELDRKDSVIRLIVLEKLVTMECAEDAYQRLSELTLSGGPYAAIYDLTRTEDTTIPTVVVRALADRPPSIPTGRVHVVVGKFPAIFGLARIFQMCGECVGNEFEVVHTMEEAYEMIGVRPEDFTECPYPQSCLVA